MPKNVRIILSGVPDDLPADRLAYMLHGIAGKRWTTVTVEGENPATASDSLTGEQRTQKRLAESALGRAKAKAAKVEPAPERTLGDLELEDTSDAES